MTVTIWSYAACGTCKSAIKWLREQGIDADVRAIVAAPPDVGTLRGLWERSGIPLDKLFNISGNSYREGGFKDRLATMSDDQKLAALAADGMLIKRPLVDAGAVVLVGFKPEEWEQRLC
jgi:arsenate reductase (glutaredoxin)